MLERESPAEDTWLDRSELQQIDPEILEYYESYSIPTRRSRVLSHLERMMRTCIGASKEEVQSCVSAHEASSCSYLDLARVYMFELECVFSLYSNVSFISL